MKDNETKPIARSIEPNKTYICIRDMWIVGRKAILAFKKGKKYTANKFGRLTTEFGSSVFWREMENNNFRLVEK